jgi:hypothetical protein
MADVGDIHQVLDLVTEKFQRAQQDVLEQIGAQVANMGVGVNGGPQQYIRTQPRSMGVNASM